MFLSVLILQTLMFASCDATLVVLPMNEAALSGTKVSLNCSTNDKSAKLIWRTPSSKYGSEIRTIYTGNKMTRDFNSYQIENDNKGMFNLKMEANEETARKYNCEENKTASAELIVLASDPVCSVNINDLKSRVAVDGYAVFQLQCELTYWGNWEPTMEWQLVSEAGSEPLPPGENVDTIVSNNTVKSVLTSGRRTRGTRFKCTTRFSASKRPNDTNATNVPTYSFSWMYPSVGISGSKTFHDIQMEATQSPVTSPPSIVVVLVVVPILIISGLVGYIVHMKRKQRNSSRAHDTQGHLSMEEMIGSKRPISAESTYVEIRSSRIQPTEHCRGYSACYTGLNDEELDKTDLYTALSAEVDELTG